AGRLRCCSLLPGHRASESLLGGDLVVGILGGVVDVDLDPLDLAAEGGRSGGIVVADRRRRVGAEIGGLVAGEDQRHRPLDSGLASFGAIDVEGYVAAFAEATAVVAELHPDLVLAGRQRLLAGDLEAGDPEQVVTVSRTTLVEIEAPAAEGTAL